MHYDSGLEQDVQDVFITSLAIDSGQVLVSNEKGQHFTIDPSTRNVTGDARGCDGAGSGGCSHLAARALPAGSAIVAALGALVLAGMLLRRRRRGE